MILDPTLRGRLLETIAGYHDDIIDLTEALVAIPTENPPGADYVACMDLLARKLAALGIEHTVIEVPDTIAPKRWCLVAWHGPGPQTLYFHGHYDVVPASQPGQFAPRRQGALLFGRGSADMKGGLAAMIYAVQALRTCGAIRDGRIGFVIVPDEETGGSGGSSYLATRGLLGQGGVGMLTPEPSGGTIWNANRGAITLRVTVRGRPAHVGLHYQGVNAFERMLELARSFQSLEAEIATRRTTAAIEPEAAQRSILLLGGECSAGNNFNVVPAACSFTVDRRINPEEDLAVEKERLLALLRSARDKGIEVDAEILQEGESAWSPTDGRVAEALMHSVEDVVGRRPRCAMCPGLLETRFYARRGVPAYAFGPGLLSVAHGPHEFVKVRDLVNCAAVYALTAVRLLS